MSDLTEKSMMLRAWMAAAGDSLARHAGGVAAGRVADSGLATAIGIVGHVAVVQITAALVFISDSCCLV